MRCIAEHAHTPHTHKTSEGTSILHPVHFGRPERWKTPRLSLEPRCHPCWPRGRPCVYLASWTKEKKKQARPGHSINKGPRSWERRQSLSKENNRRADPEWPEKTNTADENAAASERLISGQMQLFPLVPLSAVSSSLTDFSPPHWPSVCSKFSWNSYARQKRLTIPYQMQRFLVLSQTHTDSCFWFL